MLGGPDWEGVQRTKANCNHYSLVSIANILRVIQPCKHFTLFLSEKESGGGKFPPKGSEIHSSEGIKIAIYRLRTTTRAERKISRPEINFSGLEIFLSAEILKPGAGKVQASAARGRGGTHQSGG